MSTEDASIKGGGVTDLLGTVVADKYRIDRLIGQGGMGAVFQATNLSIGKRVALKFLNGDAAREKDATERFQREALAASLVESSHIVQIFDSGTHEGGLPFLVMELLTGEDLRSRLKREGRLSVDVSVGVAVQVLRALLRAHGAGIVHRDLKPENVFLCERDDGTLWVKIVDFGISKLARMSTLDTLTRRGTVLGTAYYMSPEQAQAFSDIDGRADLYSLGAILYECLTGRPPHTGPTYEAVLIAICTKDAEDVQTLVEDATDALGRVLKKALARNRDERYASAREFLEDLNEATPTAMTPKSGFSRSARDDDGTHSSASAAGKSSGFLTRSRRPRMLALATVATLSGFGLTGLWAFQNRAPAVASTRESSAQAAQVPANTQTQSAVPSAAVPPAASAAPPGRTSAAPGDSAGTVSSAATRPSALPSAVVKRPARNTSGAKPRQGVAEGLTLSTREP